MPEQPKVNTAPVIDGASIDIIALPGAVSFRLREQPGEPIYVFSNLALAEDFCRELAQMIKAARMLAANGPVL